MSMLEFTSGMDIRSREPKTPTVAKFWINDETLAYCIIGTDYGHIHTSDGSVRTWKSYSSARKFAVKYKSI